MRPQHVCTLSNSNAVWPDLVIVISVTVNALRNKRCSWMSQEECSATASYLLLVSRWIYSTLKLQNGYIRLLPCITTTGQLGNNYYSTCIFIYAFCNTSWCLVFFFFFYHRIFLVSCMLLWRLVPQKIVRFGTNWLETFLKNVNVFAETIWRNGNFTPRPETQTFSILMLIFMGSPSNHNTLAQQWVKHCHQWM